MSRVKVVAEIGASHHTRLEDAKSLIFHAYECGCDAVKIQTFDPALMCPDGITLKEGPWEGMDLRDLYRVAHTPREWHKPLFDYANHLGIELFSTPFHPSDVEFLQQFGVKRYKIASPEIDYRDLWTAIGKARPEELIVSLGCADADKLVELRRRLPHVRKTFLFCRSNYTEPTLDIAQASHVISKYRLDGISDHSKDDNVAKLARLPITMIERHIRLVTDNDSLDSGFATHTTAFRRFVEKVRYWESRPIDQSTLGDSNHPMKRGEWTMPDGTKAWLRPSPTVYGDSKCQ